MYTLIKCHVLKFVSWKKVTHGVLARPRGRSQQFNDSTDQRRQSH